MVISVITTVDDRAKLETIGRRLLEKRLVACLQIVGPMRSTYWWKGALEEAEEWMAVMKTRENLYDLIEREIKDLHPYEVPEIVAVEAKGILPAYRQWIWDQTISG